MISPSSHGPVLTKASEGRNRKLSNAVALRKTHSNRGHRPGRDPVPSPANWENARVVLEACFGQNFESPQRAAHYGEVRCSITLNPLTEDLLYRIFGT